MEKILVPVDGSESSERALGKAIELAYALKAKLMFLYVANVNQLAGDVVLTHAEERASDDIETERVMETGSPAPVIADVAEEYNVDLIVMGSRGLGLVKGVLLGSVSQYVVENAKCAVMVVK